MSHDRHVVQLGVIHLFLTCFYIVPCLAKTLSPWTFRSTSFVEVINLCRNSSQVTAIY